MLPLVSYLRKGRAKVTIVSSEGKEATITLLAPREFVGEESLASVGGRRLTTATALTACTALRIERDEMIRAMHGEHQFSDLFIKFLLVRGMRTQADLVDQLFNSSEKRLARILLLMAEFGRPGETGIFNSQDLAGKSGRDDRLDAVASQLFYESLSQVRLHRVRRAHSRQQVAAEHRPSRQVARRQCRATRHSCHATEAAPTRKQPKGSLNLKTV